MLENDGRREMCASLRRNLIDTVNLRQLLAPAFNVTNKMTHDDATHSTQLSWTLTLPSS